MKTLKFHIKNNYFNRKNNMEEIFQSQNNKPSFVEACKCIDQLNPIIQEFNEYFSHFDDVLIETNENQESILRKKYRFFLTKLKKLEEIESRLRQKYNNLGEYVENSLPIRQQKKSISFIQMISAETLKKLGILGVEVQQARQIKKENKIRIVELKGKINKLKSNFFQLKKQEMSLLKQFQDQKKSNILNEADKKFRKIVKEKVEDRMKKTSANFQKINQEMRYSQGFQNKNKKISKSSSNFYPSNKQRKSVLTNLDQVNVMKQSLLKQVEQLQQTKKKCMKNRYDQLISNWDQKFRSHGIKWWIKKGKNGKNQANNQNYILRDERVKENIRFMNTSIVGRKFQRKNCKGCQKKQQQVNKTNNLKFELLPRQISPKHVQKLNKQLLLTAEEAQNLKQKQENDKNKFLQLSPQQIIKIVSKKNKIYELSKLIQGQLRVNMTQNGNQLPLNTKESLRC